MSPKFRQEDGYTFKIYSNEEERKHIHVVKAEYEAKFWLEPNIELAENYGFNTKDLKKYNRVPWLRDARVSSALNVRMCGQNAIEWPEWPELDVDLEIESLKHPERYPLVMKRSSLDVIL